MSSAQLVRDQVGGVARGDEDEDTVPRFRGDEMPQERSALRGIDPKGFALLKSQPNAVVRRLLRTIESNDAKPDPETFKRIAAYALLALNEWVIEVDSVSVAEDVRDRLLAMFRSGTLDKELENDVVGTISRLTMAVGLDDERRFVPFPAHRLWGEIWRIGFD